MLFAPSPMQASPGELRERFAAAGQGHVFRFWDALDADGRARLRAQAERLDPEAVRRVFEAATAPSSLPTASPGELEAPDVLRHPAHGGNPRAFAEAREAGEAWLAEGRAAALVVAGGQGTRLGMDGPKGALPIGPVSARSLFALQAQRLRGLTHRLGLPVPWLVMTSEATDAATRALFAREGGFGLAPGDVRFFRQASLPVLDLRGRLLLAAPDRIAEAPAGHGGVMPALLAEGVLAEMEARGVEALFHYQVDNPLLPVCDPVLLGVHRLRRAEMTSKVVRRRDPEDRMGTLVRTGGRLRCVEYSEVDEPLRSGRDARGALRFWAGSIGVHAYAPALVRRMGADPARTLPLHAARKRVRALDPDAGDDATPRILDAVKLERFVFDALPHARPAALVEALRDEEYAPVKRPEGAESPGAAQRALDALYRRWLEEAGVAAPPEGSMVEIDHARIPGPHALRARGLRAWHEAGDAIVCGDGARR